MAAYTVSMGSINQKMGIVYALDRELRTQQLTQIETELVSDIASPIHAVTLLEHTDIRRRQVLQKPACKLPT